MKTILKITFLILALVNFASSGGKLILIDFYESSLYSELIYIRKLHVQYVLDIIKCIFYYWVVKWIYILNIQQYIVIPRLEIN